MDKSKNKVIIIGCHNCNGYMHLEHKNIHVMYEDGSETRKKLKIYRCHSCDTYLYPPESMNELFG